MKSQQRLRWLSAVAGLALALGAGHAAAQKTQLIVYTALETDQIKAYEAASTRPTRTSSSSGCATPPASSPPSCSPRRRIRRPTSSSASSASSLARVRPTKACSQPYAPKGLDKIIGAVPRHEEPAALGRHGRLRRGDLLQHRRGAEAEPARSPRRWKDLTKPVYKGKIVMPNPASSGTGFLDVAGWLQMWGEARRAGSTWTRCTRTSRSTRTPARKPCKQAGAGEFPIGISFEYRAMTTKKSGRADRHRVPEAKAWAGTSRRSGIMKGTKKLDAAKKLMDWLVDAGRDDAVREELRRRRDAGHRRSRSNSFPPTTRSGWSRTTSHWSAKNRDRILAEWTKRYNAQVASRSERERGAGTRTPRCDA